MPCTFRTWRVMALNNSLSLVALSCISPFSNPLSALFYHPFTQNCQVCGPLPSPISLALNFSKPSLLIMWPSCLFLILRIIIILLLPHSQNKIKNNLCDCPFIEFLQTMEYELFNYNILSDSFVFYNFRFTIWQSFVLIKD